MKFRLGMLTALAVAILLSGCADQPFLKPKANNESMIIGYVDMDDAPGSFNGAYVKQIRPVTAKPYYNFWIDDGTFYRAHVKPGIYKMDSLNSFSRWFNTSYTFNFPQSGSGRTKLDIRVTKPGVYYVGSWKYKEVKTGFFEQGKFDLVELNKPTELELLKQVLPKADDPYWSNMIKKRIRELEKR